MSDEQQFEAFMEQTIGQYADENVKAGYWLDSEAKARSIEAQTSAAVLGHNFPNSEWYKNAYALLQSGGLSPQMNQGTWLSNAIKAVTPGSSQKKPEPAPPAPSPAAPASRAAGRRR